MNADDFKRLADIRLAEAQILLDNGKFDGAFYLAGYAVECGLKACIANQTRPGDFPPEWKVVKDSFYTHSLEKLFQTALNVKAFEDIRPRDARFQARWVVVKDWSEVSRYENHNEKDARDMLNSSREVLEWLKHFW